MTEIPQNIKDKSVPLLLEHLDPENFAKNLGLLPHQVQPVWDKVLYAFSLGIEFGYISCGENIAKDYLKIFPEAKNDIDMSAFSDYVVGQPK